MTHAGNSCFGMARQGPVRAFAQAKPRAGSSSAPRRHGPAQVPAAALAAMGRRNQGPKRRARGSRLSHATRRTWPAVKCAERAHVKLGLSNWSQGCASRVSSTRCQVTWARGVCAYSLRASPAPR